MRVAPAPPHLLHIAPLPPCSKPCLSRPSLARTAKVQQRSPAVETRAVSEIAQVAGEAGFIFGVSGVMAAIVLVVSCRMGQGGARESGAAEPAAAAAAAAGRQPANGAVYLRCGLMLSVPKFP